MKPAIKKVCPDVDIRVIILKPAKIGALSLLLAEGLNLLHAREVVLQKGVQIAYIALAFAEYARHLAREFGAHPDHQRHGDKRQRSQRRVDGKEYHRHTQHGQQAAKQVGQCVRHQYLNLPRIVDRPRHNLPGLLIVVKTQRQLLQLIVDLRGQVGYEAPRGDMAIVGVDKPAQRTQQIDPHQHPHIQQYALHLYTLGACQLRGQAAQQRGGYKPGGGRAEQPQRGQRQRTPMLARH